MPSIRPFRALRYSRELVPDLAAVTAPPYDVIGPEEHRRLLARDPRNVVRLDFPRDEPGDPPDERYRRAARTLAAWRSDGTLRRDVRAALYPYEQTYRVPGTERVVTRLGVFARVELEPFGPGAGIRPHERTLSGPKEDRYRLLRATNVNTSPVVGLYEDPTGTVPGWLGEATAGAPLAELRDDAGVEHRLWAARVGEDPERDALIDFVARAIGANAITLADGHHRYETALRYAADRRRGAVVDDHPAWNDILMLLLEPGMGRVTVLATHRLVLGLDDIAVSRLLDGLPELFDIQPTSPDELRRRFAADAAEGGRGLFGVYSRSGALLLQARRAAFAPFLDAGGPAVRRLDVTLASVALERLAGIDATAVGEGRLAYTMSVDDALSQVDASVTAGGGGSAVALLLEPTPATEIAAVAADGDLMPQKSTYIYPKALTGLVINPLE